MTKITKHVKIAIGHLIYLGSWFINVLATLTVSAKKVDDRRGGAAGAACATAAVAGAGWVAQTAAVAAAAAVGAGAGAGREGPSSSGGGGVGSGATRGWGGSSASSGPGGPKQHRRRWRRQWRDRRWGGSSQGGNDLVPDVRFFASSAEKPLTHCDAWSNVDTSAAPTPNVDSMFCQTASVKGSAGTAPAAGTRWPPAPQPRPRPRPRLR